VAENYPHITVNTNSAADQPCLRVTPLGASVRERAADGAPWLVENRVGRGRVFFTPDPIELHSVPGRRARDLALYRRVLAAAGVATIGVQPEDPRLQVFRVPLADGGRVHVVFNTDESQPARPVTLTDCRPPLTLTVARRRPGLVWFDRAGALRAVETQGPCVAGNEPFVTDDTQGMLLTLDGQDVRASRALLLMPLQPGQVRWASAARWSQSILDVGEIQNGAWRSFETRRLDPSAHPSIPVSADQAFSLLLVCEQTQMARWRQSIERAMTAPGSLR
jgi:hypothetical protein